MIDTIDQWRSTSFVGFNDNYLFGGGAIVDISGERMERTGNFPEHRSIAIQDTLIAAISIEHHLILYDFDPPNQLTQLCGTLSCGVYRMTGNYWINGHQLFLSPYSERGGRLYGAILQVVDISNPRRPYVAGQIELLDDDDNRLKRELFAREGDVLFLTIPLFSYSTQERLQAVNVRDPERMRVVGEIVAPLTRFDTAVLNGTRLYLQSIAARFRWDLTGPFEAVYRSCYPQLVSVGGYPIGGMYSRGDLVYSTHRYQGVWRGREDENYLRVTDYSTPATPTPLYDLPMDLYVPTMPNMPVNQLIEDRYLLISNYESIAALFDLIDPERPEVTTRVNDLPADISVISNEYAIGKTGRTLELWSLADMFHPQLADCDSVERNLRAVAVYGDIVCAFVRDTSSSHLPLTFRLDIDAGQLNFVGRGEAFRVESGSGEYCVTVLDGGLVVLTCSQGFLVWDIADPTKPHLVGSQPSYSGQCREVFSSGDNIIINDCFGVGWFRMSITDTRPNLTTDRNLPFQTHVGECDTMLLSIRNVSEAGLLHIDGITLNGDGFEVEPYGQWIKPLTSWERQVLFQPREIARYEADLTIHLAEGEPITIPLTGYGISEDVSLLESSIPLTTNLRPCKPNPFNAMTTIVFELESHSHLQINLFDMQGRCLETICVGDFARGQHQTMWLTSDLASGIYILQMKVDDRLFQQKVSLVK
ncbi:MAG: T9SS type A sorting domain-containing protein [Candidatus Hatepunaea meridiana]|nr:T9SS type A sorting domain-containing protein [Candidatus Hatepunaea meridiana]